MFGGGEGWMEQIHQCMHTFSEVLLKCLSDFQFLSAVFLLCMSRTAVFLFACKFVFCFYLFVIISFLQFLHDDAKHRLRPDGKAKRCIIALIKVHFIGPEAQFAQTPGEQLHPPPPAPPPISTSGGRYLFAQRKTFS